MRSRAGKRASAHERRRAQHVAATQVVAGWGSDVMADMLRSLEIPYIALTPGASFRGLHDSLVNHLGNTRPELLLCIHEETAVALAHGYARVTGRPLAVALHANVGLMHATMAIFNAWCDRIPMLLLGGVGPLDAMKRRPWVDWIHTSRDLGALVRGYTKWDDLPGSVPAALEAILRAYRIAMTPPQGPAYVALDVALQEEALAAPVPLPELERFRAAVSGTPPQESVREVARLLEGAKRPLLMIGRGSSDPADFARRVALAERIGAVVLTDIKTGATLSDEASAAAVSAEPVRDGRRGAADRRRRCDPEPRLDRPRRHAAPGLRRRAAARRRSSSVRWISTSTTATTWTIRRCRRRISRCSPRRTRWWRRSSPARRAGRDAGAIVVRADRGSRGGAEYSSLRRLASDRMPLADLARVTMDSLAPHRPSYIRLPLGWPGEHCRFEHPLDYIGFDGGGGIGSGPGMAIGAALALRGGDRLPVAVLGDGDYLMGLTALWTGVHYRIPVLIVIANNESFFNDELHQERMARVRGRPVENRWIGLRLSDPDMDLAGLARDQGAKGYGPVRTVDAAREPRSRRASPTCGPAPWR